MHFGRGQIIAQIARVQINRVRPNDGDVLIDAGRQHIRGNLAHSRHRVASDVKKDVLFKDLHIFHLIGMASADKCQPIAVKTIVIHVLATNQRVRTLFQVNIFPPPRRSSTAKLNAHTAKHHLVPLTKHTTTLLSWDGTGPGP